MASHSLELFDDMISGSHGPQDDETDTTAETYHACAELADDNCDDEE